MYRELVGGLGPAQARKQQFFTVSAAMLEATTTEPGQPAFQDIIVENSIEEVHEEEEEEEEEDEVEETEEDENGSGEAAAPHSDGDMDGDSLDEGLGDISSDGDTAESPEPKMENFECQINLTNKKSGRCGPEVVVSASPNKARLGDDSPQHERRPSRISFETPL